MLPRICYIEANLPDFIFGVCEYTQIDTYASPAQTGQIAQQFCRVLFCVCVVTVSRRESRNSFFISGFYYTFAADFLSRADIVEDSDRFLKSREWDFPVINR